MSSILRTICLPEPKCYLSPFTSQSQYKFCLGDHPPIWRRDRARGRGWYLVKLLHSRYHLFAGIEMLSLSVYEPIVKEILLGGTLPEFWEGVELGVGCGTPLLEP